MRQFILLLSLFSAITFSQQLLASVSNVSQLTVSKDSLNTPNAEKSNSENERFLVVIDPGHGGTDFGTTNRLGAGKHSHLVAEKDITLSYAQKLSEALAERGIPSLLTRTDDSDVSLDLRSAAANRARASLFISLHVNSAPKKQEWGFETFVLNQTNNQVSQRLALIENGKFHKASNLDLILADLGSSAAYKSSVDLACHIHSAWNESMHRSKLPLRNRGIKSALFYVLMQTSMPSLLVELGFASNPKELQRLIQDKHQHTAVTALANGILRFKQINDLDARLATKEPSPERTAFSAIQKSHHYQQCTVMN